MKIFQQLRLGAVALQVARHAAVLLQRIGAEAVKRILREVCRLEVEEPNKTGREKFDLLVDFMQVEIADALKNVDLTKLLVTALVELFKLTGLFQSSKRSA